jgi:hypothetical protein
MGAVVQTLNSATLIRDIYRALLNTGRTYAAFTRKHMCLLDRLRGHRVILDPMSGYGSLMKYCSESDFPVASYGIEGNPPAFYWQYLTHPENLERFEELSRNMLRARKQWPRSSRRFAVSDEWFPDESFRMLDRLLTLARDNAEPLFSAERENAALALLLPFVGRLSSSIACNVVTHVKQGGICVYEEWQDDFSAYIQKLREVLGLHARVCKNRHHTIHLGDARKVRIKGRQFSAMITSPPYPNGRDYFKMFAPENAFIEWTRQRCASQDFAPVERLIGSSDVSEDNCSAKYQPEDIKSDSARSFVDFIARYKGSKRAISDNASYYTPYFCNYFGSLERAYENIANYLSPKFEGYIIVSNNTARKRVVPVAAFITDTWQRLGFTVTTEAELTEERSHVGGINPRVKGLSARHTEYTVKICR